MTDLDREIRRLASEIQAVEQTLVEVCGLPPVTPVVAAGLGPTWARGLRSVYHACAGGLLTLRRVAIR